MAHGVTYARPGARRAAAAVLSFLCMSVSAGDARAASFSLDLLKIGMDLSYDEEFEKRQGPYSRTENTTRAFREKLDLETGGWIYHPALLTHKLRLSPEWEQLRDDPAPGAARSRHSFLTGYSADLAFLPEKPTTLNLFGARRRSTLKSSFAGTSETEADSYGATMSLKYRVLPLIASYVHTESVQTGFYESWERRDDARLHARHEETSNDTTLTAGRTDRRRTAAGMTLDTKNIDALLHNLYRVTPDQRVLLNSNVSARRTESAFLASSGTNLSEALTWRHARNFSSHYTANHAEDSLGGTHSETTNLGAGLSHLLYENLQTALSANASHNRFTGGRERVSGGNLDFEYRRSVPEGMLSVNAVHDYRVVRRTLREERLDAAFEPHVLRAGDVTLLARENADPASVSVNDATRTITYLRDVDYRIEVLGSFLRISRTSFGAIAEGQAVLVSYRYLGNPAFDYSTFSRSYGADLALWSAWRISYRYGHSKQTHLEGVRPAVLNSDRTHTAETDLAWRWTTTKLVYEDTRRSGGVSTARWLATEYASFRPRENLFLGLSGHAGRTRLKERHQIENLYGLRADAQWLVMRAGRIRLEGFFDKLSGALNKTEDTGGGAAFEWFNGLWSGELSCRFRNEKDLTSGARLDRRSLFMRIKRALF